MNRLAASAILSIAPLALALGPAAAARPKPRPAPARPAPPPVTNPKLVAAERRYQEAMRAFEAGERVRARALFEVVLADLPAEHPLFARTLYNLAFLADAEVDGGEVGAACRAERAYLRYLDAAPSSPEHARTRGQAEGRRETLGAQCEAERTPVTIAVTTEESAPEPRPAWILPAVGTGALLAAGAGVGLQFWAQSAIDERDRAWEAYREVADRGAATRKQKAAERAQDDAEFRVMASYAGFGLGAALLGTTVWLWLTEPSSGSPSPESEPSLESEAVPDVRLFPLPGGLGLSGAF